MTDFEKLGLFYLGRPFDPETRQASPAPLLYDSTDLVTHAVCVGMTGSGKTGLCIDLLEEAAIDGVPAIAIDPKGDLGNLLLTFPGLSAAEFRPWIDEDEARRNGRTPDEWSAAEADRWRAGLAEWGQSGERIERFRESVDACIYTPGSQAGLSLSVLRSFAAPPPALVNEADLMRERVSTTVASLLGLAGVDADPITSREHILVSTILDHAWRNGEDVDLPLLIQRIQSPPLARVGVLELEAFYPAGDRFKLAMAVNNLLASPGFSAWTEGEPLDVQRLLFTPEGKPRLTILSIAHLDDAERMFFVAMLFNEILGWTRQQPGTTSLRALVYMDEIAGYLPPVANPASKAPMLTMLKQARAYGVGVVLATQNPIDLDYKALSNAGTWFVGRLQTERDQERVLDGLEGASAAAGAAFDRARLRRIVGGLGKRVFLLHNVHETRPEVFETRWALSYLRGPLTRTQIRDLMADRRAAVNAGTSAPESVAPAAGGAGREEPARTATAAPTGASSTEGSASTRDSSARKGVPPVLPAGIAQYFVHRSAGSTYEPVLVGVADVRFANASLGVDVTRTVTAITPILDEAIPVDWKDAAPAPFVPEELSAEPPPDAAFGELPRAASEARNYVKWSKGFTAWLSANETVQLWRSPALKIVSAPGESEGDFRVRVHQAAREARDAAVAKLRQKYAGKVASLEERIRRAQLALQREQQQVSSQQVDTAISFGATVLGALFGRKVASAGTIGRATTAARGMRRVSKESDDVARAQQALAALEARRKDLEAEIESEIAGIEAHFTSASASLDSISVRPARGGVHVRLVALAWVASRM